MGISSISWLEAQYSVLGDVLIDGGKLVDQLLAKTRETDFSGSCLEVFRCIRRLKQEGSPVDPVTVYNGAKGKVSTEFLVQLMDITPTTANFQAHVDALRNQAGVLAIRDICDDIRELETLEEIRPKISELNRIQARKNGVKIVSIQDAIRDFFRRMDETPEYIPTPIDELDEYILPEFGDLCFLGAYSSCGKTAMAIQWADKLAQKYKVAFFSLETRVEKLADRYVAYKAGVSLQNIKKRNFSARDSSKICAVPGTVDNMLFDIIPMPVLTVEDIERISTEQQYQVVFIDYVQIIESSGRSETEEIKNVGEGLQRMAKRNSLFVVGLSQLTEDNMGNGYEPYNHSLRGSRALEHTADIILLMYLADKKKPKGNRIMKVSKNKDGEPKRIELEFDGPCQRFSRASGVGDAKSRKRLVEEAAAAAKRIPLCYGCARKMEESYTVSRVCAAPARSVECWLCGQKLMGEIFILDKRLPGEPGQLDMEQTTTAQEAGEK